VKSVCYRVKAYPKAGYEVSEFTIQTPDYPEEKIKAILLEVHPEYIKLELEKLEGLIMTEWSKT